MRVGLPVALVALVAWTTTTVAAAADDTPFIGRWAADVERVWLGPEYWANPLQDWRVAEGRIECQGEGPNRSVHLLTRMLGAQAGELKMSVRLGTLDGKPFSQSRGSAGFRVGIHGPVDEYRYYLIHGQGLDAGLSAAGTLFIGSIDHDSAAEVKLPGNEVLLQLSAQPRDGKYALTLSAVDPATGENLATVERTDIAAEALLGNLAVVNNFVGSGGPPRRPRQQQRQQAALNGSGNFWFADWRVSGSKVSAHDDRAFGPILFAQYTLSRGVMKLTAQLPPIGERESQVVTLFARPGGRGEWVNMGHAVMEPLSRTATFRVPKWDDQKDTPYRLVYEMTGNDGLPHRSEYTGTIRHDPTDKPTIVVAGFTGNTDTGFPNHVLAANVAKVDPDVLVFTGDQLYENVAGFGIQREPVDVAALDYLRKWYVFGWAFRDLMRDRPSLCFPDDHDVYQGNIWGASGRWVPSIAEHDQGGYAMPAEWVNMVQRTQTSHHPDPYDPAPVDQGITVYFGTMVYGRIGFACIEDRKFKSGPAGKVNYWEGRPDHVTDRDFDPKSVDKPGLELLGGRQLAYLDNFAEDWRGQDIKVVLSQTIFANLANYHGAEKMYLVADLDSNGWPQSGRNAALHAMRRGFMFHLAGDQHLASIVHHGIDEHGDAGYSFCVPSIAAGYPRSWLPHLEGQEGQNRKPGAPPYTGDFYEGLGNRITVYAVGNPDEEQRRTPLELLHDKASGFGVIRLHKDSGDIDIECYRLLIDIDNPQPGDQFPDFPKTINLLDNYGRAAAAYLPTIEVTGLNNPVVQVIDGSGEVVYTVRARGTSFRPKVYTTDGDYTVRVGEPDKNLWQEFKNQKPAPASDKTRMPVAF